MILGLPKIVLRTGGLFPDSNMDYLDEKEVGKIILTISRTISRGKQHLVLLFSF